MKYLSTKVIPMGSTAFRQWRAESHCKFIHGYRLQCKLWFSTDSLDDRNWVFDFGDCKDIKVALEEQFDHTTCVAADDPELHSFQHLNDRGLIQLRIMEDGVGIERSAEWVYNKASEIVKSKTNGRVFVDKVEVWEHEGNSAVYEQDRVFAEDSVGVDSEPSDIPEPNKGPSAPPRQRVTQGMSNPFGGTSWGE
jgi:6-pyruvoyltetrahydropterin/6-carboxytetrahydropterin synthase